MRKPFYLALLAALAVSVSVPLAEARDVRTVLIQDRCDPATFPPESGCVGQGRGMVTFEEFLEDLPFTEEGGHHQWAFEFGRGVVDAGEVLEAVVDGGEVHTFTEVSSFGAGVVPELNISLPPGTPPAVPVGFPDLGAAFFPTLVLPGGTFVVGELDPGSHMFQCLIHPWMRITIEAEGD